jgi:hypothetical protein
MKTYSRYHYSTQEQQRTALKNSEKITERLRRQRLRPPKQKQCEVCNNNVVIGHNRQCNVCKQEVAKEKEKRKGLRRRQRLDAPLLKNDLVRHGFPREEITPEIVQLQRRIVILKRYEKTNQHSQQEREHQRSSSESWRSLSNQFFRHG